MARFFPDHEIYVRSGGEMRFLRITTGFQMKLASMALLGVVAWLMVTAVMVGLQIQTVRDRLAIGAQQEAVSESASRVQAYRSSVDGIADRLEKRQQVLDRMVEGYFGSVKASATPPPAPAADAAKISATIPEAAPLARIEQRQLAFAETLTMAATMRAQQAEQAIRRYGLNPKALSGARPIAMGGPYIPVKGAGPRSLRDLQLARLATSLRRLDLMERTLLAIPNSAPTAPMALTSGFGYRADPFTGGGALHAGLDFSGHNGQPIAAAAAGRVTHAGPAAGYGNLVTIDHGHGIETRYGHLSGFDVKVGDVVARGEQVARMGNTGRSTGTHLHFEVRVRGQAMNPRPFLEANTDVLKVQDSVKKRFAKPVARG
ncbi:M23 family metallopeptidase [Sphingomonas cavernae]|uniref:M23 family metallopeptidase n=1 Tax=Sphingomonas cavernae TaxID=2320861 RepID=A0A418WKF6_9SPHN|nr:M23 family metallopeptidase [Sphingomonas cavernae]RJF90485.1 M23 family metallopeptidase [Sphingomonas cavernae]